MSRPSAGERTRGQSAVARCFPPEVRAHLSRDGAIVIRAETIHADGSVSLYRGGVPVRQIRFWPHALAYFEEDGRVHAFRVDSIERAGEEWRVHVDGHRRFALVLGPVRTDRERAEVARWHDRKPSPYAEEEMRTLGERTDALARDEAACTRGATRRRQPRGRPTRGGSDA